MEESGNDCRFRAHFERCLAEQGIDGQYDTFEVKDVANNSWNLICKCAIKIGVNYEVIKSSYHFGNFTKHRKISCKHAQSTLSASMQTSESSESSDSSNMLQVNSAITDETDKSLQSSTFQFVSRTNDLPKQSQRKLAVSDLQGRGILPKPRSSNGEGVISYYCSFSERRSRNPRSIPRRQ